MYNPRLALLPEYPFPRLRTLLDPLAAPERLAPITMSIGEPQHAYPDLVKQTLAENDHLYAKYPPNDGTPELRQAIADWLTRRYQLPQAMITAERHVLPVSGTREALFMAALIFVPQEKAGRQPAVLMPNPFYQCYAGAALAAGAEPVYLATAPERDFFPDLDALSDELLARTAMFYLCTPANPQGTVADAAYLGRLIELAREWGFVLALDECYSEIYTGAAPIGTLEVVAKGGGALDNVLVFHSLSKRSNVAGLRSGFVAGDPALIERFLSLRDYGGSPMPLPVQATSVALWAEESHVDANRALYREKFDLAGRVLGNRFGYYRPAGGFFLWLDVADGIEATRKLWTEAAIRVLPGSFLSAPASAGGEGDPGRRYIRIALVPDIEITGEALRRLAETL